MAPPASDPLVAVGRQRALVITLAAAAVPGRLNLRQLVNDVACRRVRRVPPRELRRSLRRGVQVVVDRGPALDPFRDDVMLLSSWLGRVVSPAGLQRLTFSGDPLLVTVPRRPAGAPNAPRPYREEVPAAGCTVVVVTDLGIAVPRSGAMPALPSAWREHHRLLRQAGCRAVYLVPYPPGRWPAALAKQLPVVYWRDGLRADQVNAAKRLS